MEKIERIKRTVDTGSVDRLARILGAFDENLRFIWKGTRTR